MPEPDPVVLPEPGPAPAGAAPHGSIWLRGLMMVIFAILIGLAQTVLGALTIVQFVLMVFGQGKPNPQIASFGKTMGAWLAKAAAFQTAQSEVKPWPFEG